MKTKTVTVREGEYLGPVDWSYDFSQHDWKHSGGTNPEKVERCVEMLRRLGSDMQFEATTDGGWPRFGWGEVLEVGMYDGWPYWKPVPSVLIAGTLGATWHSFMSITDVREINQRQEQEDFDAEYDRSEEGDK